MPTFIQVKFGRAGFALFYAREHLTILPIFQVKLPMFRCVAYVSYGFIRCGLCLCVVLCLMFECGLTFQVLLQKGLDVYVPNLDVEYGLLVKSIKVQSSMSMLEYGLFRIVEYGLLVKVKYDYNRTCPVNNLLIWTCPIG